MTNAKNMKLLRVDLPADVWDRLNTEAADAGLKIGKHVQELIVARDARKHGASSSKTTKNL